MIRRLTDYGNLFFECDSCQIKEDSHSNKIYGIVLPDGWKSQLEKTESQKDTNQDNGIRHLCPHCTTPRKITGAIGLGKYR